ncbi:hypothetical protein DFH06DRAFT_1421553 [Mycena polygramma]|nr:hypothetical protein DFH06DRAFT_1421553 [Mycena polygramma]
MDESAAPRPLVICCICAKPTKSYVSLAVTTACDLGESPPAQSPAHRRRTRVRTWTLLLLHTMQPSSPISPSWRRAPPPRPLATCSTFHDPLILRLPVECARLISTLWSVVDARMEAGASIVNALVDILDEGEQREAVLPAWRTFELEFPEFVPSAVGSGYAGITSGRVLNAKHPTAGRGGQGGRASRTASHRWRLPFPQTPRPPPAPMPSPLPPPLRAAQASATPPGCLRLRTRRPDGLRLLRVLRLAPAPASQSTRPFSAAGPSAGAGAGAGAGVGVRRPPKLLSALFPELPPSAAGRTKAAGRANVSLRNILGMGSQGATPVGAWGGAGGGRWWGCECECECECGDGSGGGVSASVGAGRRGGEARVRNGNGVVGAGGGGGGGKGKGKQTLFALGRSLREESRGALSGWLFTAIAEEQVFRCDIKRRLVAQYIHCYLDTRT